MANPPPPGCGASVVPKWPTRPARWLLVVAVLAAMPLAAAQPATAAEPDAVAPVAAPEMTSLPSVEVPIYANFSPTPTPRAPTPAGGGGATTAAGPGTINGGPSATITVNYDAGFNANPAAKAAFQAAVDIWAAKLSSPVPITVDAKFDATSCFSGQTFGPNTLGSAGPRFAPTNFPNAPHANVFYPAALANALAGSDLVPGAADLCAAFNPSFNTGSNVFYFGTDGNPPLNDYDFMSVVLHELGHGLGFVGAMRQVNGTEADCCFGGMPLPYDVQTFTGDGATLLSKPHPSAALLTALTSGNVFFRGPLTNAAAGAGGAKLFAPGTFQSGSSYSHLDETFFQPVGGNALMTPSINNSEVEHDPGPITLAMFADMGWPLAVDAPGPPRTVTGTAGNAQVAVSWLAPLSNGGSTITSYTVTSSPEGKTCTWTSGPLTCTITGLTNGDPYTFTVRAQNVGGLGTVSTPSAAVTPRTTPGAPTNLVASSGNTQGTVTWMAPESDGGATITGYTVTASPGGATCTWTSGPLTCTVTGLTNGISHTFTARAQNSVGLGATSAPSNAIVPGAVGAPGAPTGVAATVVKQAATVSWTAPSSPGSTPITSYVVTSTPDSKTCTWTSGPLQCNVTGLEAGVSHTFTVAAYNSAGPGFPSAPSNAVVPWSGSFFHPLDPTRILDSRNSLGGFNSTPLGSGSLNVRSLAVTTGLVPSTASAVVLNVTATNPTANSFLTVFPTGSPLPTASNLNFGVGQTIPNLVTVQVGTGGTVNFFNALGSVHVIADIVGYYDDDLPTADRFTALDPQRVLDSRGPLGGFAGKLNATTTQSLDIRGLASVPDTATAIVANITATDASQNSFLTVYPSGPIAPSVSNLNFAAGQTIPNLAVVKLGADGTITFKNFAGAVHVVVDLVGYFDPTAGSLFHPRAPVRMLDSRSGPGFTGPPGLGPVSVGQAKSLLIAGTPSDTPTVPVGASAVVMNTTVTGGTAPSFLTVFPGATSLPNVSNLNFAGGQTIPNLVSVKIGADQRVQFANAVGSTHVIADVVGYYAAG